MIDVHTPDVRSRNMQAIKAKDTKPELLVRSRLFKRGFRYRLHRKDLPGKPDLVLRKYKTVIFINGCFWHGHACKLFKLPQTNTDFWKDKINATKIRDKLNRKLLLKQGWRVITVWECSLKSLNAIEMEISKLIKKIRNNESF